jgi:hypothetical protein
MSDNASEFRSAVFGQTVATLGMRHTFIRAGRLKTNGCVERVQQTILDECWKPAFARYLIPKQTGLRLDLERYLRYDNTERSHTGRWTKGRTPEEASGRPNCGRGSADASPQLEDRTDQVDGQPLKSKVSFCTRIVPSALTTKVMVSWMRISPERSLRTNLKVKRRRGSRGRSRSRPICLPLHQGRGPGTSRCRCPG